MLRKRVACAMAHSLCNIAQAEEKNEIFKIKDQHVDVKNRMDCRYSKINIVIEQ